MLEALVHDEPHKKGTFVTVRHRNIRSNGCLSNRTALGVVFKLVEGAKTSWRWLGGHDLLPNIIHGANFADALKITAKQAVRMAQTAAA